MSAYAVINLKTDPELKKQVMSVADSLGVSVSAVLNNELRRFAREKKVSFELPEVPNAKTVAALHASRKAYEAGEYYTFETNEQALDFLQEQIS